MVATARNHAVRMGLPLRFAKRDVLVSYLLTNGLGTKTYIGYTNFLVHRLRQHRGELARGARYTRSWSKVRLVSFVAGFTDKHHAMSFEWRAKNGRKRAELPILERIQGVRAQRVRSFAHALCHAKFATQTNLTLYYNPQLVSCNPERLGSTPLLAYSVLEPSLEIPPLPSRKPRVARPPECRGTRTRRLPRVFGANQGVSHNTTAVSFTHRLIAPPTTGVAWIDTPLGHLV